MPKALSIILELGEVNAVPYGHLSSARLYNKASPRAKSA